MFHSRLHSERFSIQSEGRLTGLDLLEVIQSAFQRLFAFHFLPEDFQLFGPSNLQVTDELVNLEAILCFDRVGLSALRKQLFVVFDVFD